MLERENDNSNSKYKSKVVPLIAKLASYSLVNVDVFFLDGSFQIAPWMQKERYIGTKENPQARQYATLMYVVSMHLPSFILPSAFERYWN